MSYIILKLGKTHQFSQGILVYERRRPFWSHVTKWANDATAINNLSNANILLIFVPSYDFILIIQVDIFVIICELTFIIASDQK